MNEARRAFVVDQDATARDQVADALTAAGYTVIPFDDTRAALTAISADTPDVVLCNQMMPGLDGLELTVQLRRDPALAALKIIILSTKSFDYDRRRAREFGADGYLVKPIRPDLLIALIDRLIADRIELTYWGVRGTLPVPGPKTVRYGGNTSCVAISFPDDQLYIFDAGSGIKWLGNHLMAQKKRITARLFLSHPHWDHINALPFFTPLYVPGNQFEILGPAQGNLTVQDLISAQMDGVYFPVTVREFGATIHYRDLREETLALDGIEVTTMLLSHPGYALGYRVRYKDRIICYVTDNEFFLPDNPERSEYYERALAEFVRGADLLITDACYTDQEYPKKVGWGHSAISQVALFADAAAVKRLHLFHHDPDQDDEAIDAKLKVATDLLREKGSNTEVAAPAEGDRVLI